VPARQSGSPTTRRALNTIVAAADLLIVALVGLGAATWMVGAYRFTLLGARVSVSSAWRPLLLAAVLLAIRLLLDRRAPWLVRPLRESAHAPLQLGEAHLFGPFQGATPAQRWRELGIVVVGFVLLTAAFTWPQVRRMDSVPDLGDPLFSIWRISWVNHQIWRQPLALFDTNIFYPERLTLAYSDPVVVPALMAAPLFWLGIPKVVAYNLLFLSAFVFSGVGTYYFTRALTGRRDAAAVAGVVFALYPFRFEHYSHLELQMTMWMPLALWGLHRAMAAGRLRDGLATGAAFALQMLSSLYFGVYFAVFLLVVGAALWIARRYPWRPIAVLAAGAVLAGAIIAPVAAQYVANRPMMGDRDADTVEYYSAQGPDYLKAHFRSFVYEGWSRHGNPERQLFPRIAPVALALAGAWPPLSVTRIAYAAALAVALDGSLGMNGVSFPWLREHVPGYSGLRVPARFSILVGLSLAILSGFGAARLIALRPAWAPALTVAILAVTLAEALPNITLERVWPAPPGIYAAIGDDPDAVLAEFPMPANNDLSWTDTRYLYFSTFHWHKMVNGNSGFSPPSYREMLTREREFPSPAAVDYLRERGVDYLALHGAFTNPTRYRHTAELLEARGDLELVTVSPWEGSESRLYRFRH
jgi:hypothetical protein